MNNAFHFPLHLIDPAKKDENWVLNYFKAAWHNFGTTQSIFYHRAYKYREIKDFALGNQSIDQYKDILNVESDKNETWLNIDWRVLPIITKFRRIALNKLKKIEYDIDAIAIDSLAVDQKERYIAEQKAKIALRDSLQKTNPELAQKLKQENDADDIDELKVKELYTYKHNATIEVEAGIDLIMQQNDVQYLRTKVREDLFDYGVSGYKDWIDSAGNVKFRRVNPATIVISNCLENDFSDKQYAGEVVRMTISDLKQAAGDKFTADEYKDIAFRVKGKFGNPNYLPTIVYGNEYNSFNIDVLDLEFYSVNEDVFEKRVNKRGNPQFGRTSYNKRKDTEKRKYKRVAYKVVYQGSWIIGTDHIFNAGLASNMKRVKSRMTDAQMSYHFYAPEFFDMEAKGITEQLIPIANAIQIAWYRLQNAINQARPKGVAIDLDALEAIPIGSGGKELEPYQVVDMFNETGTLVYRRSDMAGALTHYKPIEEIENGLGKDSIMYYDIIQRNIQMIRDITGLNELVDGSTPDPRTLTTVAEMAAESSNNALGDIVDGDQHLLTKAGTGVYLRLQEAVKSGNVNGYTKALGSNSVKFIKVSADISMHEFGIFLTLVMSDDERLHFKAELKEMANAGVIEPDTAITIGNIRNKAQADQVLAYMVKITRERKAREANEQIMVNSKAQQESAQVAEQAKQATVQLENKGDIDKETVKGEYELKAINLKGEWDMKLAGITNQGKIQNTAVQSMGRMAEKEQEGIENAEINKDQQ